MMAGYFDDGSHALSLLGKKMISASRRLLSATKVTLKCLCQWAFPLKISVSLSCWTPCKTVTALLRVIPPMCTHEVMGVAQCSCL